MHELRDHLLMGARNAWAHGDLALDTGDLTLCPNCGSASHKCNLIPEASFKRAARGAKMLRALGHTAASADVLTRLAAVKVINFIRPSRQCLDCGVTFDE